MASIKHTKHASIERPLGGKMHRLEFGFLGAPCGTIQNLCASIATKLPQWKLTYIDADHGEGETMSVPYSSVFTDKISFHRLDSSIDLLTYGKTIFNNQDALLVNGNHFKTDQQVLIINTKKKDSLHRKLDRIKQVNLILLDEGEEDVFDFLKTHLDAFEKIPVLSINAIDDIAQHISDHIVAAIPSLMGLVFAGGKSTRMGEDKGALIYHQNEQREHMAMLLETHCGTTYISTRPQQTIESPYPILEDRVLGLGPFGGLVSAFQKHPNNAFLTIPCDVPLVDKVVLDQLVNNRNPSKIATCFHNPETKFPEPLITIWEPRAYPVLLQYLSQGYSCPRKVLINSDIEELVLDTPEKLFNANTQEDRDFVLKNLK